MKIKKIDIHGFKSFVDKTTLIFPKGVTAIVGPNGCGKSNIVDAIRWVLGEQNARHLRGKLMEDIIFTGSETRKPIGMSEVVLTFSNEEGIAPAEYVNFTEIEIARRLYRSGESEYYINKVQCRLKDIVELFTDTGIGTRAYSIIEQGQVGWLVNAKPEERRVLFEEAAGINKYKHRKDAALRRLEATKQNLVRVSDIIGEVKRQMNSLNRQAKKAEKYKAMREELKGFELFLASEERSNLIIRRSEGERNLELLTEKEIEFSTELSQKSGALEDAKTRYLKEEADLKEVKRKEFELDSAIKEKEKELHASELRVAELRRNGDRLFKEVEGLTDQCNNLTQEIDGLTGLQDEMHAIVKDEESRLHQEECKLKQIDEDFVQKDEILKGKKEIFISLMNRAAQIKNDITVWLKDEGALSLSLGKWAREKEELEKAIEDCKIKIANCNFRKDELGSCKKDIEEKQKATAEQLGALEEMFVQKESKLNSLKEEFTQTSSRLHALKELERNFEGFKDGVRAIMLNKKEESDYRRVHGLVADVIETAAEDERAVEAVLGDRLQYVIVESQREGMEAVEYLRTQSMGRVSFVPLKDARLKEHATEEGFSYPNAQRLISRVRVKDGYHPIAQYLLGDVLLVSSLNDAVELWKSNGIDKTFVTPDGEMIDEHGIITGGHSNGADEGILHKKREIKDLVAIVDDLEKRIADADNESKRLKYDIAVNQKKLDALVHGAHSNEIELVNIEGEIKREEGELNRLKQRLETLESEISNADKEKDAISREKARYLRERELVDAELKETETAIRIVTEELSVLHKKKDEVAGLVTTIKVKLATSTGRLDGIRGQIKDKKDIFADVENKIREKQAEIEKGREEMSEQGNRVAGLKNDLEAALREMDGIRKEGIRREEAINMTAADVGGLEESVNAIKKELTRLKDEANSVNLNLKEAELNLAHLAERIIERYGVTIDSYIPPEEVLATARDVITARIDELKSQMAALGEVSIGAIEEYRELEERHEFLLGQQTDLQNSVETLHKAINRINRTTRQKFKETFDAINFKFNEVFPKFFQGGKAELRLVDEGDLLESGIEIVAQPPGKRLQNISLLSGGEKALTATSLIFSIFLIKPSPFCLLDEVDAPLDDANIGRFNGFLKEMAKKSQFILITHNKGTMEIADTLFGVTMEEAGVSKIVSVNLN